MSCRENANRNVTVPDSVKELIISLRNFLQETCEPPVYVSDRRLLKSVAMLKVRKGLDLERQCSAPGKF